jgi:hypothetical protein
MFNRDNYYSLTDMQKKFGISRSKLQLLLDEHKPPVIENQITYGTYYSIIAKYYLKEAINKMMNLNEN